MTESMKFVRIGKEPISLADVFWKSKDGHIKSGNLFDVCCGLVKAPKAVRQFAEMWASEF